MSYDSAFAGYYDLFYESKDYAGEAAFVDEMIRALLKKDPDRISILELACGTGTHSLLLASRGYLITATDRSGPMLAEAERKGLRSAVRPAFIKMDMSDFQAFSDPFDVVLCLFDSIGYLLSNEAILATLRNIRRNIKPGGIFIMEFWNAGAMLRSFEPYREKVIVRGVGAIKRISETKLHYAEQMAEVHYSILESKDGNSFHPIGSETHFNRFFLIQEMDLFLQMAGLKPVHHFDGFRKASIPDLESWHTVTISTTL